MSEEQVLSKRDQRVSRKFSVRVSESISDENPRWDIVTTQNISASGILFSYNHYVEMGARLRLKIALPICGAVECVGEVVRNVMGKPCGFGRSEPVVCAVAVVFCDISEENQRMLREFVQMCYVADGLEEDENVPKKDVKDYTPRERRIDRSFHTRARKPQQAEWVVVVVQNISASGVLFTYGELLEVGSGLALRISLPFLTEPVVCWGQITRVEDKTPRGATVSIYDMAVKFSVIDESVRQKLREYGNEYGRE